MRILDKSGKVILHRRFNFFVSQSMYAWLKTRQKEGNFSSLSALIRDRIGKRKVIHKYERYALDKAMWLLSLIHDNVRYMEIDLREMTSIQLAALDEGAYPGYIQTLMTIERDLGEPDPNIDALIDMIKRLSEIWLPE